MTPIEQASEIIRRTNDGDQLAPQDLYLVECAVNGRLNDCGMATFADLYANVTKPGGYTRPWFHGIEHLTKDHAGYVYWKGRRVEHYSFYGKDAHEREKEAAHRLARACLDCEARGLPVTFANLVFEERT